MSGNNSIGPSIARVGGSAAAGYQPGFKFSNLTQGFQYGSSPVKDRAANSANPITGGVGSQSLPPRGVQPGFGGVGNLPPGGFQNTGGPSGAGGSGAPQNGGGEVAKSGQNTPQKTSGTSSANPYGKTTPPGQSPNDAFTNALLEKVLNDRKKGEEAVQRNKETGKVENVDTAKLDEKTKEEINKLSEVFKKDALELERSIQEFKETFKEQLQKTPEDKNLDGILDKVAKEAKSDSMNPTSKDYNPQKFMDAAKELDTWIKDNPDKARAYGEDLTKINDKVQAMSLNAQEQIALAENNPKTVLRAAELSAKNSGEEAERLKETLTTSSKELPETDQKKVTDFQAKLDESMKTLNPGADKIFDVEASNKSLNELKQSFNELPEAVRNNPELADSFKEVSDLGKRAVDGQTLARTEEPNSAEFQRQATEYIKGQDGLDASWAEHRTKEERETDVRTAIDDDPFLDKSIADFKTEETPESKDSPKPETTSPEAQRQNPEDIFAQDDTESINQITNPEENTEARSDEESIDLKLEKDIEDLTEDSVDDAIDNAVEDIEIPDPVEELDLGLYDLDLNLEIE
jgi:hypothetical protein